MRRVALVPVPREDGVLRLILHAPNDEGGAYLFPSRCVEDRGSIGDNWYIDADTAQRSAREHYGVPDDAWTDVEDPLPDCMQDFITPTRVVGRNLGAPQWGHLEQLRDGVWVPLGEDDIEP